MPLDTTWAQTVKGEGLTALVRPRLPLHDDFAYGCDAERQFITCTAALEDLTYRNQYHSLKRYNLNPKP